MTRGAILEQLLRLQMIFLRQLATERLLRGARMRRIVARIVMQVENFRSRAQRTLGIAVTLQTPLHLEARVLPHKRHFIDCTMTTRTTDAFVHVDGMIEIDKARKAMNAIPDNRLVLAPTVAHRLKHFRICPDLRMTRHADLCRRHSRERRVFHRRVAIPAVDPQSANVMLMAERNRLRANLALPRDVRRFLDIPRQRPGAGGQNDRAEDCRPGDRVHRGMEQLRHMTSHHIRQTEYLVHNVADSME